MWITKTNTSISLYSKVHCQTKWQTLSTRQIRGGGGGGGSHIVFFLFLHENVCCGYSLEAPQWGASNEYHNISFHGEIRKMLVLFGWKKCFICTVSGFTEWWHLFSSHTPHWPFLVMQPTKHVTVQRVLLSDTCIKLNWLLIVYNVFVTNPRSPKQNLQQTFYFFLFIYLFFFFFFQRK